MNQSEIDYLYIQEQSNKEQAEKIAALEQERKTDRLIMAGYVNLIGAQARQLKQARDAIDYAYVVLSNGDFKNGVTDPTGTIDEGEVYAGKAFEKLRAWLAANAPAPQADQEQTK